MRGQGWRRSQTQGPYPTPASQLDANYRWFALLSIALGVVCCVCAIALLAKNEADATRNAKQMFIANACEEMKQCVWESPKQQQCVHVTCDLRMTGTYANRIFPRSRLYAPGENVVWLREKVEMYQWIPKYHQQRSKAPFGLDKMAVKTDWHQGWAEYPTNSSVLPEGKENPSMVHRSFIQKKNVNAGVFHLSSSQMERIVTERTVPNIFIEQGFEPQSQIVLAKDYADLSEDSPYLLNGFDELEFQAHIQVLKATMEAKRKRNAITKKDDGKCSFAFVRPYLVCYHKSPLSPSLGDYRINYLINKATQVSIVGEQHFVKDPNSHRPQYRIKPWINPADPSQSIDWLVEGEVPLMKMIEMKTQQRASTAAAIRVICGIIMFVGLLLFSWPFTAIRCAPMSLIIGELRGFLLVWTTCHIGAAICLVIVAVSWIFTSQVTAVPALVLAFLLLGIAIYIRLHLGGSESSWT